jgi:hypothetical protein
LLIELRFGRRHLAGSESNPKEQTDHALGHRAGEWLIVTRYVSWKAYGRTLEAVAKRVCEAISAVSFSYAQFETARAASVINHI